MRRKAFVAMAILVALFQIAGCAKNRQATVATHGSDHAAVCTSG